MEKNVYQILQDWHELLKSGVITEEEFAAKKKELLGRDKRTSKNSSQEDIRIRTLEEQAQYDAEYELLFSNKSWFQKNKGRLIVLGIAIIAGILIWYLSSEKSNANSGSDIYSQSKSLKKKKENSDIYSMLTEVYSDTLMMAQLFHVHDVNLILVQ